MTETLDPSKNKSKASDNWANPIAEVQVSDVPAGALNINLQGRHMVGALQGFGQLWQKTFRVRLEGAAVTPQDVIRAWKENFHTFQPPGNHFYPSMAGIKPGELVMIDTKLPVLPGLPGLIPIATGVMIIYSDDVSFTVMTPEGFPIAGWNTFSAYYEEDGCVVAQAQSVDRPTDPIYEFGFRIMGGSPQQDAIWKHVLSQVAAHFGVKDQPVDFRQVCLDKSLQWRYAKNDWFNAGVRTMLYVLTTPFRKGLRMSRRKSTP